MRSELATVGARGIDSLQFSNGGTRRQADDLAAKGIDFFVGYLGAMNPARLSYVLDAGMAFMPVTFGGEYKDGAADEIAQLNALGIPHGVSVWLDLEGIDAWNMPPPQLIALIEAWARDISDAGWMACLYVGAPQPLTGTQLYALKRIVRYWLGIGRCIGLNGLDAYPDCGWTMRQDWHNKGQAGRNWRDTGVYVDTNSIQCDHRGRLPTWCR